jgi:hypothetical protein
VASLARPGGNATGLTNFAADLIERILAAEITEAASFGGLFHFEPQARCRLLADCVEKLEIRGSPKISQM